MKKRLNFIYLLLVIFILMSSLAFANSRQSLNETDLSAIPIEELDTLPIEKTYSYEEMVEIMEQNNEDKESIQSFKKFHEETLRQTNMDVKNSASMNSTRASSLRYQVFSFDAIRIVHNTFVYYLTPQIQVGLLYYDNSAQPDKITGLVNPHIHSTGRNSSINGGHFAYDLVAGNEFSIWVAGKLYDGGTTLSESSIGGYVRARLGVSRKGSFVTSISKQYTYYSSSLNK